MGKSRRALDFLSLAIVEGRGDEANFGIFKYASRLMLPLLDYYDCFDCCNYA